jgi:hypothetical protein
MTNNMIVNSLKFLIAALALATLLPLASSLTAAESKPAQGPLRIHPDNPRYFTDGTKLTDGSLKAVYLTGSHHWHNLQDAGRIGGPVTKVFDYDGYLDFLAKYNHNFIRLWAWEGAAWWYQGGQNDEYYVPLAYARTGPGKASDGKPKFDLEKFNPEYFDRLRSRVIAARDRGIYVGVMLFQGWSIYNHDYGNPWPLHPFNQANNINGINGDPDKDGQGKEVHTLQVPAVTRLQEAYVRKVIDTVNDLDNVLYEITNETALWSAEWQYHIINFIKTYQATKPKQHPVGITAFDSGGAGSMDALFASPADWISPQNDGVSGNYMSDPPAADGRKVIISDTDHLWGVGGDRVWVWKSFARGHHTIYMDPLHKPEWVRSSQAEMEGARIAMGQTGRFAERMKLAAMIPRNDLASTRYCLADPGGEYLVYQPRSGAQFSVELAPGSYEVEWFSPADGKTARGESIKTPGGEHRFKAPFEHDAVLYLKTY